MKTIKRALTGVLALSGLLFAGVALAVGDSPGGPAVNELNLQPPATAIAEELYNLHTFMLILCTVIFIGVFGVMFYSIFAHRKSKGHKAANFHERHHRRSNLDDRSVHHRRFDGAARHQNGDRDEGHDQRRPDRQGHRLSVEVGLRLREGTGRRHQLRVDASTPRSEINGQQPITDTYLQEVDQPARGAGPTRRSASSPLADDVVHSWYVPAFGVKQDAIPGFVRDTWIQGRQDRHLPRLLHRTVRQGTCVHAGRGRSAVQRRLREVGRRREEENGCGHRTIRRRPTRWPN